MNDEQPSSSFVPTSPPRKAGKKGLITLVIVLVVFLAGAIGYGVYSWMDGRSLASDVDTKQATIEDLTNKVSQLSKKTNELEATVVVPKTSDTTNITELGLAVTLPGSLSGVTYSYMKVQSTETVGFSTKQLTDMDEKCSSFNGSPLGVIFKVKGQYPKDAMAAKGTLVKQFTDYYVAYSSPQGACSSKQDEAVVSTQLADFKKALKTLKEVQ